MIAAPAFIVSEALAESLPFFSVGVAEYFLQGLFLIVLCLIIRRFNWRFLLTFAVSVIYGYTLNFFLFALGEISFDAVWLRWVMLIVGDALTAIGVACCFRTYMPVQVCELFVGQISRRFNIGTIKVKRYFDLSLLALSVILAFVLFGDVNSFDWSTIGYSSFHSIGLGTIVTTLINSPLIKCSGKMLDMLFGQEPLFPKLSGFLNSNDGE
jgi:uncharacterized membrane protein YczE